ncbi:MAG TPA: sialidase family protein [Candidatus Hydrogenedentes bacterium]|nr:sialidase family protein [Candidatus Hydrogenedentota bacterium]
MNAKTIAGGAVLVLFVLGLLLAGPRCRVGLPDVSKAPGVVIGHQPSPSLLARALGQAQYVGSPSIAMLPDGACIASHDLFGRGSSQDTSGVTKVFRSTDKGATWRHTATLEGQFWSTVFVHNGGLFILGYTGKGGDIVIRSSTDGGFTWTTPIDGESGLIKEGRFGGTPNRPVVYEDRLWIGQSSRLMSAPVDSDLLRAASWTLSKPVAQDKHWLGGRFTFWSEGQAVVSPAAGVVLLPKVNQLPYTALLRSDTPKALRFDPYLDFVELPGAEKKFGAAYDAVSGKYYICSNPVLPAHRNDWWLRDTPALIRNCAALLSSSDLHHWSVEKIFLYSPDVYHAAFQYLNFEFDGDDLAVISRTAFVIGGHKPPRGHDSNLMTFHRIRDFRHAAPDHELEIEGNRVLRYERTQCERAPLGVFTLGAHFDGAPLQHPAELAQDTGGQVYVREQGGRILRFDAAGNYLGLSASAPVSFAGRRLSITQPHAGERSWTGGCSDAWGEPSNWYYWGRPDTPEELAIFGSASVTGASITIDLPFRIKGIRFCNVGSYTLAGPGELTIGAPDSEGRFEVVQGRHTLRAPIHLSGPAYVHIDSGAGLSIEGPLHVDGTSLLFSGEGSLELRGLFSLGNGRLILYAGQPVVFGDSVEVQLNGTLEVRLPDGVTPALGDRFNLFNAAAPLSGAFDHVELPRLANGLAWNTAMLYTTGVIEVVSSPIPAGSSRTTIPLLHMPAIGFVPSPYRRS